MSEGADSQAIRRERPPAFVPLGEEFSEQNQGLTNFSLQKTILKS